MQHRLLVKTQLQVYGMTKTRSRQVRAGNLEQAERITKASCNNLVDEWCERGEWGKWGSGDLEKVGAFESIVGLESYLETPEDWGKWKKGWRVRQTEWVLLTISTSQKRIQPGVKNPAKLPLKWHRLRPAGVWVGSRISELKAESSLGVFMFPHEVAIA